MLTFSARSQTREKTAHDLVPVFYAGSPQTNEPDMLLERRVLRQWKKEGRGYFASNGRVFQLTSAVQSPKADWGEVLRAFGVRGESTRIDEPAVAVKGGVGQLGMMGRYVIGETRARIAVESYR